MLAELLNLPCATTVIAQNISDDRATVTCERELEGGRRERVLLPLPAVLTIQSGINVPRYASLTNVLRVKDYDVPAIKAGAITASRPRSEIVKRAWLPEKTGACEMLTGDLETMAETLAEKIRSKVARG
jgi:electron transfer flavoprotein beta subunit